MEGRAGNACQFSYPEYFFCCPCRKCNTSHDLSHIFFEFSLSLSLSLSLFLCMYHVPCVNRMYEIFKKTSKSIWMHECNINVIVYIEQGGTRWCSRSRHCATSRKVAGSIPDGVIGIFPSHNPSGRTVALGSTQPLTEMSTRNISWGVKGGRCVGLTNLTPSCADCLEIWEPQHPGTLRACSGL